MPSKGKILLYNVNEGSGMLLDSDKKRYPFVMENWEDFDNFPEIGMTVTFELKQNTPVSICKSKEYELELAKKEKEHNETLDLEDLSAKNVEKGLLDKNLHSFFSQVQELDEDEIDLGNLKTLDFFRMKRFLYTAFNNLTELDSSILEDPYVLRFYTNITQFHTEYDKFKKTYLYPKLAFSNIFLKYTNHQKAQRRLELNINEMSKLKGGLKPIENELKIKMKNLSSIDKKSIQYEQLSTSIKKTKRLYVDTIDKIGELREENERLIPILEEYYELFYDEFIDKFELNCRESLNFIQETLNALAYGFDKYLWAKAKKSKIIQAFFKDAHIEGNFNSLAYLNYYLKALDETKLSEEQQELFELKEYLEKKQNEELP